MFRKLWQKYRRAVRKLYIVIFNPFRLLVNCFYDYLRYIKYSDCSENMKDHNKRNYYIMFIYHGLEKSMSYQERRQGAGWRHAQMLVKLLKVALLNPPMGYHDLAAFQVLKKFIDLPENKNDEKSKPIQEFLEKNKTIINDNKEIFEGVISQSLNEYQKGILNSPRDFFLSRYTLREFNGVVIEESILKEAINISTKTPSVCNRQPWKVYHAKDDYIKKLALSYQNGNKPFGDNIPNLLVITIDLNAFHAVSERYQGWIDGGMYVMSLTYILHSMGIGSCILNWSQLAKNDKAFRQNFNIPANENIIAFMGVGYPNVQNRVCESKRKPYTEILKSLRERDE